MWGFDDDIFLRSVLEEEPQRDQIAATDELSDTPVRDRRGEINEQIKSYDPTTPLHENAAYWDLVNDPNITQQQKETIFNQYLAANVPYRIPELVTDYETKLREELGLPADFELPGNPGTRSAQYWRQFAEETGISFEDYNAAWEKYRVELADTLRTNGVDVSGELNLGTFNRPGWIAQPDAPIGVNVAYDPRGSNGIVGGVVDFIGDVASNPAGLIILSTITAGLVQPLANALGVSEAVAAGLLEGVEGAALDQDIGDILVSALTSAGIEAIGDMDVTEWVAGQLGKLPISDDFWIAISGGIETLAELGADVQGTFVDLVSRIPGLPEETILALAEDVANGEVELPPPNITGPELWDWYNDYQQNKDSGNVPRPAPEDINPPPEIEPPEANPDPERPDLYNPDGTVNEDTMRDYLEDLGIDIDALPRLKLPEDPTENGGDEDTDDGSDGNDDPEGESPPEGEETDDENDFPGAPEDDERVWTYEGGGVFRNTETGETYEDPNYYEDEENPYPYIPGDVYSKPDEDDVDREPDDEPEDKEGPSWPRWPDVGQPDGRPDTDGDGTGDDGDGTGDGPDGDGGDGGDGDGGGEDLAGALMLALLGGGAGQRIPIKKDKKPSDIIPYDFKTIFRSPEQAARFVRPYDSPEKAAAASKLLSKAENNGKLSDDEADYLQQILRGN